MSRNAPQVVPYVMTEVPLPNYPLIVPREGSVWLSGQLTAPVEQYKLNEQILPPGLYKTVRDDLAKFSTIPVTRVALNKHDNEYVGVIDSNGDPYLFVLSAAGMAVRKAVDSEQAWKTFETLIDAERHAGLLYKRKYASNEFATIVYGGGVVFTRRASTDFSNTVQERDLNKDFSFTEHQPISGAGGKQRTHVQYSRHSKTGKLENVGGTGTPQPHFVAPASPFHAENDPIAHQAHLHLQNKKLKSKEDVIARLHKFVRKQGSDFADVDKHRLYAYMQKHRAFVKQEAIDRHLLAQRIEARKQERAQDKVKRAAKAQKEATAREKKKAAQEAADKRWNRAHDKAKRKVEERDAIMRIGGTGRRRIGVDSEGEQEPATPTAKEQIRAATPDHHFGIGVHSIRGEPEEEKKVTPRGTTSIWQPGDDERNKVRREREEREKHRAKPKLSHEEELERNKKAYDAMLVSAQRERDKYNAIPEEEKQRNLKARHEAENQRRMREAARKLPDGEFDAAPPSSRREKLPEAKTRSGVVSRVSASIRKLFGKKSPAVHSEEEVAASLNNVRIGKMSSSVAKALAKKDRTGEGKSAKKTTSKKAASKKAGKNGKTRYNYPQDKQQAKKPGAGSAKPAGQKEEETGADPIAVPREPVPKSVNPQQLANQLQIPVHTLQHIAKRFKNNTKLKGRSGFISFMKTRLRAFTEKHKLDGDFFGLLYDALVGNGPTVATKA